MTTLFVLLILMSTMACLQGHVNPDCPRGYKSFESYCYAYIDHKMTWTDATSTCAALGGFLAEAFTHHEGRFLHKFAVDNGGHSTWLGADDLLQEGLWTWITSGELVQNYTDWHHGQPQNDPQDDENCLEMNFNSYGGQWNDDECEHKHRFICQRQPGNTITTG